MYVCMNVRTHLYTQAHRVCVCVCVCGCGGVWWGGGALSDDLVMLELRASLPRSSDLSACHCTWTAPGTKVYAWFM